MIKSKEKLIDLVYEEADKLARSWSSRAGLFTEAGRVLCLYIANRGAKDLAEAILEEREEMLEYEKDPRN